MQITLNELVPLVRQLSAFERFKLVRILVDELDYTDNDIAPFEPYKTYHIYTPVESFGAAKTLLDALETDNLA